MDYDLVNGACAIDVNLGKGQRGNAAKLAIFWIWVYISVVSVNKKKETKTIDGDNNKI